MRISYHHFFLFLALALLVIVLAVLLWIETAVRAITVSQAQASAERWVAQIELSIPELPTLLADGLITEEQRTGIEAILVGSQVFQIQFFNQSGAKVFATNGEADLNAGEVNPRAVDVINNGITDISVETRNPMLGEPERYVEIFMPIYGDQNELIGVAELYVDGSGVSTALGQILRKTSGLTAALTILLLAIPGFAILQMRKQLNASVAEVDHLTKEAKASHDTLKASIEALPHAFVLYDRSDRLVICNEQYRRYYPKSAHAMREGASYETILRAGLDAGEYRNAVGQEEDWLAERLTQHFEANGPVYQHLADGRRLQVIERKMSDGGRVGLRIDITDYIDGRERAERAEQRLLDAIEALPAGFWLFDQEDRLVMFNEQFRAMYGASSELLELGRTYEEIIRAGIKLRQYPDAIGNEDSWLENILRIRAQKSYETVYKLDNGRWIRSVNERTSDGGIVGFRVDITELKEKQLALKKAATTNFLTGVLNRRGAELALKSMVDTLQDGEKIALLHIDLDSFKSVNDSFGHKLGDLLLVRVAEMISQKAPEDATIARVGGDEFLVAYVLDAESDAVAQVADTIIDSFARPVQLRGQSLRIGASIGVATWSRTRDRPIEDVMQDADIALYVSKQRGRNAVTVFEDKMRQASVETARIAEDVARGLENAEFAAYFQPIVDAETWQIAGFEALARWKHPDKGVLTPAYFMAASEIAGHAPAIDRASLKEAIKLAKTLQNLGRTDLRISVNLSEGHLNMPDVVDQYLCLIKEHGVSSNQFRIEILETTLLEDRSSYAGKNVSRFKEAGFAIDLDDFGIGHTAIASLRSFNVDRIKIDRSLVAGVDIDPKLALLTEAIVGIGRRLGLMVLAEGVECNGEVKVLEQMGCTCFQGFYFAHPMPAEACIEILSDGGLHLRSEKSLVE